MTQSGLLTCMAKRPGRPKFMKNVETVVGLMSICLNFKVSESPKSMFFVAKSDSACFHGSLFDHPGCSIDISVNSGLKTSIQLLFLGVQKQQWEIAEGIIQYCTKKGRFKNMSHLSDVVSGLGGQLDEAALRRIRF
ncbi:hypothetical protein CcCBS67573_g09233 [Chytriomyces confervae]|uniref:Uncharacterized protein n=1 Tax=Chytriomyces confervae TaxID=246404 RepID=A0A507E2L8_9FUNG|nr:hypothetical protein CcCBS67573_g09233 [Chytriomyces confervae]